MEGISEIDEKTVEQPVIKKKIKYETKNYKTIKEVFDKVTVEFKDRPFILEKFDHKEPFTEISYGQFRKDVIGLGTGLIKLLNLKEKRVVIIGENTYHWYVSYIAMLCGVGIAVPVDKELPANEIENVVKRAKASAVIYSTKKKEVIKKIKDNLPEVEYFIEMNEKSDIQGRDVGASYLIEQGNRMVESGDHTLMDIEIDPEEFKVLIFTSGTTSKAKGVMINNKNLSQNVNVVGAYVYIGEQDRFFSVLPLHHTYESSIGFLLPMSVGASVAICEGLKYIVPNLQETKPSIMLTVPLLVENLYKKINANIVKSKKDKLVKSMIHLTNALKGVNIDVKRKVFKEIYENLGGNLRIIVSAAAPIDPKVGKWVQDIGISFLQGYGLTETAPIAALTPEFDPRVGSAGKAVTCAKLKINHPNEAGEGEVFIKSETFMLVYYED